MSNKVFTKSLMRKPLKLLVWALLIFVIGFAFTAKMTEYLVVRGEIERIEGYYRAIGRISAFDENHNEKDCASAADYIESLDTVAFGQRTPVVAAGLVGLQNADIDGYSGSTQTNGSLPRSGVHSNNVYFYGTLAAATKRSSPSGVDTYYLVLDVDKVEAGYEDYVRAGDRATAFFPDVEDAPSLDQFERGGRYFIRGYFDPHTAGRNDPKDTLTLGKLDSERWAIPVGVNETLDFSAPENVYIGGNIDAARFNQSAVSVIGTKDMSALPDVQQSVRTNYLTDGRWLDREDDLEGNRVCVVHRDFAAARGFEVGDRITLNFKDFMPKRYGYIPEGVSDWRDGASETKTFEIVGIFGITSPQAVQPTSRSLSVYVPESCMPSGFTVVENRPTYYYSFVLNSVRDKDEFVAQNRAEIERLGYTLTFVEDNSENFIKSADPMVSAAAMDALTFGLVAVVGLLLTIFVYYRMQRGNFAIMRALGVPKRSAVFGFILPAFVIGALMLAVSSVVARDYACQTAAKTLSVFAEMESEGAATGTDLLPAIATELGVFLIMLAASGLVLSRRPVLELLQGTKGRKDAHGEKKETVGGAVDKFEGRAMNDAPRGSVPMTVPTMRYIFRQIRRTPFKTALVVLIAAGFVFALGWMRLTADRSAVEADGIYVTTVVEGEIVKRNAASATGSSSIINESTVQALEHSSFVDNLYLEATQTRDFVSYVYPDAVEDFDASRMVVRPTFIATNDFAAFRERYGLDIHISLYSTSFENGDTERGKFCPVILHESTFEQIGLPLGEGLIMEYTNEDEGIVAGMCIAGTYAGDIPIEESGFPLIIPLNWMQSDALQVRVPIRYSTAEFNIATSKNRELDSFREEMTAIVEDSNAGLLDLSLLLWDEELTKVVKPLEQNVRLMSVLYPVIAVLSVIIAAGIAALLVMQVAHETALLRAVGLKRKRVLAMNVVQMAIPCAVGIICGFVAVLALEGGSLSSTLGAGSICAAAYLAGAVAGSTASSLAVLKRRPMQLLQINE